MKKKWWVLAFLLLAVAAYFLIGKYWLSKEPSADQTTLAGEGEVTFFPENLPPQTITVEVADSPEEQIRGLMYRTSLPHRSGMLFVFEHAGPRGFWMKNTPVSLDIIYVDAGWRIVSIQRNTTPFSEETLPSDGPARYVIEVNGGFTDLYGIQARDSIAFQTY